MVFTLLFPVYLVCNPRPWKAAAYAGWVIPPPLIQSINSLTDMPSGLAAKPRVNTNYYTGYVTSGQRKRGSYQPSETSLPLVIMPLDINIFHSGLPPSPHD